MQWIGGEMNAARAKLEDHKIAESKVRDSPQGQVWQCPRCGYAKKVKQ